MFKNTITVFNFHEKTGTWYPSVIPGTDLGAARASSKTASGLANADVVTLLINCSAEPHIETSAGRKPYIEPKEYAKCEHPEAHITFTPECDFFMKGAWPDLTPVDDDAYDEGYYHELNTEHDGVYMISSVDFFDLLPHFEIGGR